MKIVSKPSTIAIIFMSFVSTRMVSITTESQLSDSYIQISEPLNWGSFFSNVTIAMKEH